MYFDKDTHPIHGFTANEDICCYKILGYFDNQFMSPYNTKTKWSVNEVKSENINVVNENVVRITYLKNRYFVTVEQTELDLEQLLALEVRKYYPKKQIQQIAKAATLTNLLKIEDGLYSFSNYMNCEMEKTIKHLKIYSDSLVTARCTIPKGSRYYVSDDATTFVSDFLQLDKIIDIFGTVTEKIRNANLLGYKFLRPEHIVGEYTEN